MGPRCVGLRVRIKPLFVQGIGAVGLLLRWLGLDPQASRNHAVLQHGPRLEWRRTVTIPARAARFTVWQRIESFLALATSIVLLAAALTALAGPAAS